MPTLTLEETIRALAKVGNLSSVSLAMNPSHTKWRASYAPAKTYGVAFAEDEDPVKAMLLAIGARPGGVRNPRVAPIKQKGVDVETVADIEVTIAADKASAEVDEGIDALM